MAKRSKTRLTKSATYPGSLGAALDEIGFKPLGRRIKVKAGEDTSGRGLKARLNTVGSRTEFHEDHG